MFGQVLRVKGYYDITGLTSMILNDEYFGIFLYSFLRIKEYYDVMIAKKWFWSCLWSVNLRLGTSYLVHRTKNFLLKPKWAPNFEISKNLGKFGLKCGTIDILCHNFNLKMNFIRVWPWKKSSIVSHFVSHAQIVSHNC